jgi:hypothetical protein
MEAPTGMSLSKVTTDAEAKEASEQATICDNFMVGELIEPGNNHSVDIFSGTDQIIYLVPKYLVTQLRCLLPIVRIILPSWNSNLTGLSPGPAL